MVEEYGKIYQIFHPEFYLGKDRKNLELKKILANSNRKIIKIGALTIVYQSSIISL
ncbi:MAG: hypothetical protein P4L62_03495 [Candidatus Pacebacteria bacterium]|nr:hypothetical protein [Candidatus Paceibacterota bacterium]